MKKIWLILFAQFSIFSLNFAQNVDFPCQGTTIMTENFESGIPSNWQIIDGDQLIPNTLANDSVKSWHLIQDPNNSTNQILVNTSWYDPKGTSDDWLITDSIVLGNNPCFSWRAYSFDHFYPESYDILISNSNDTASFNANTAIYSTSTEDSTSGFHQISLQDYANQTVYLAFHCNSNDKFKLALDDISITNTQNIDIGVSEILGKIVLALDTIDIESYVFNFGADTIYNFDLSWRVDSMGALGAVHMMSISDTIPPYTKYYINHDDKWYTQAKGDYKLCVWTNNPNGTTDQNSANDSTCDSLTIHYYYSTDQLLSQNDFMIYPNPAKDVVNIQLQNSNIEGKYELKLFSITGEEKLSQNIQLASGFDQKIDLENLNSGIFILELNNTKLGKIRKKIIIMK